MQREVLKKELVGRIVEKLKDKKIMAIHRDKDSKRTRYDIKYSQEIVRNVIEAFIEVVAEIIEEGDKLKLNGFMTLQPKLYKQRKTFNKLGGGEIKICAERYRIKQRYGVKLQEACERLTERVLGTGTGEQ